MIESQKFFFAKREISFMPFASCSSTFPLALAGSFTQATVAISFRWGEGPALTQRRISPGALHFRSVESWSTAMAWKLDERMDWIWLDATPMFIIVHPWEIWNNYDPTLRMVRDGLLYSSQKDMMDGFMWSFLEWRIISVSILQRALRILIYHRQEILLGISSQNWGASPGQEQFIQIGPLIF